MYSNKAHDQTKMKIHTGLKAHSIFEIKATYDHVSQIDTSMVPFLFSVNALILLSTY
jgi:hypothetical protein